MLMLRVNRTFSNDFLVQVGLHQDTVSITFLFLIVLVAIFRKIRSGCSEVLLYSDDLALVAWGLKMILKTWKGVLESNKLSIDKNEVQIIISSENYGKATVKGRFPCDLCRKNVGSNSSYASFAGATYIKDVVA